MKTLFFYLAILPCIAGSFLSYADIADRAGFHMPDSVNEVTIRFKRIQNLILLPVTINDSIHLNLVLDTGCRNLLLFGKKFSKLFTMHPTKLIEFSGLGSGKAVSGRISLNNKVAIGAVLGEKIPVVVVPNQNLFGLYQNVDGIIGYDVFIKFEIELNNLSQSIIFRPAFTAELSPEYARIPIQVVDSKPVISSTIVFSDGRIHSLDLMIDTGSSLSLLIKTKDRDSFSMIGRPHVLGRGLNGLVEGFEVVTEKLIVGNEELISSVAGIMYSPWPNQGSIGMEILKQYSFVLNYCKGYIGIRRDALAFRTHSKRLQKPTFY